MIAFKSKLHHILAILLIVSPNLHAKELSKDAFYNKALHAETQLNNCESLSVETLSDTLRPKYKLEGEEKPWSILKELAAKADGTVGWNIKDEKILRLTDKHGRTMAHELAGSYETGWQTDNSNILKLADNEGITVAHELAKSNAYAAQKNSCEMQGKNTSSADDEPCPPKIKPWHTDDLSILSLADHNGNTVAHVLAAELQNEWVTQDPAILMLKNSKGVSVAHLLAENVVKDWDTDNVIILKLTDNAGMSVIHTLAKSAATSNNSKTTHWKHNEKELLAFFDASGWSVAHQLANSTRSALDWTTNDPDLLKLKAIKGSGEFASTYEDSNTVAHILARSAKWKTDDPEILKLSNTEGETVAHTLAANHGGWSPNDPQVLLWSDSNGSKVAHFLAKSSSTWTTDDPKILSLKNARDETVASILKLRTMPASPPKEKRSPVILRALTTSQVIIPVTISAEEVVGKMGQTCLSKPQLPQKCVLDVYNEWGKPTEDIEKGYARVIHGATKDGLVVAQQFYPDGMPRTNQTATKTLATKSLGVEPDSGWLYVYQPAGDGNFYILFEKSFKNGKVENSIMWDQSGKILIKK